MANNWKALIGVAYDLKQAQSELDRQIKSLQKSTKLALNIELSDKEAKKTILDSSKMWEKYRKEASSAISSPNTELQKMSLYYKNLEKEIQSGIASRKKLYLDELEAYKINEKLKQDAIKQTAKVQQDSFNLKTGKVTLDNNISAYLKNNTKLSSELKNKLLEIQSQLKSVDKVGLNRLKKEFRETTSAANALGKTGDTVFTRLKKNSTQFLNYLGSATLIMGSIRTFQNVVEEVKNIDSAMISLKKVTDETNSTYAEFLTSTAQKAKELGASISDLVNATADFARLGYNLPDASKLGEVATLYKNVGDGINIGEATSSIISTLKAFNIEAENSISIIDKFNEVGNNFAISSVGIGNALQKSASALASANNTLDESIALITAGNNVVQDPDMVGTALKTVSLRLRSTASEIQNLGEDSDGAAENVSKLRDLLLTLTNQKVDIQLDEDTYKSTYQIMLDMSKVWNSMTDMSQASALEAMFGKRQANIGASILQNMTEAESVLKTSIESSGSALREQEKYQEGIQYSLDRMKASMQELSMTTLDSSTIKFIVDLANGAINATTAIGGLVPVVTALGVAFGVHKFLIPLLVKEMNALAVAEGLAESTTMSMMIKQHGLNGAFALGSTAVKSFIASILPIVGVVAVVGSLAIAYDLLNVSLKEQQEKTKKLQAEYDELETQLNSINSELSTTVKRIEELNAISSPTLVEQNELKKLNEVNESLERQNRLLKEQADIKQREVADSVAKEFDKDFNRVGEYTSITKFEEVWTGGAYAEQQAIQVSELEYLEEVRLEYDRLSKIDKDLISEKDKKKLEEYRDTLVNAAVKYDNYADKYKIDDETSQSWREFSELIDKTINPDEYKIKAFNSVFDGEDFKNAKEQLQQLAKSGELNPKVLSSNAEYRRLLDETGLSAEEVISHIYSLNDANKKQAQSSQATAQALKDITSETNSLISATSTLANALKEQADNGKLSAKTIMSIIDAGYANVLVEENGQLKLSAELYKIVAQRKLDLQIADLELLKVDLTSKFNRENLALGSMALTTIEANKAALEYHKTQAMMSESGIDLNAINAQIKALEAMKGNLNNDKFWDVDTGKSSKSSDPWKDAFDKRYNDLKHQLTLDKITQEEYFNSLTDLNKKYFAGRAKYIDEDRKNLEELYSIQKSLNAKLVSDMEHNLTMGINKGASEEEQISSLKVLQNQVHQQAQYWRSQGLDENHEYIKELQSQWWKYQNQIVDIREKAVKKAQDAVKDAFEEREKLIEEQKKNELDALEKTRKATIKNLDDQIDKYKEIINKNKELLNIKREEESHQDKLNSHTNEISKIESEIITLTKAANSGDREAMAQKRKLEEDLNKAKGDLAKTQKDHEYDLATNALDKELTAYEKMKKSEIDSMESYYDYEKVKIENNYSEKLSLAQSMHDQEMQMIEQSANLMKTSYGSALDELSRIIENANLSIASSIELQSQSLLKSTNITIDADKLDQLKKSMSTIKLPNMVGSLGNNISNISNISNNHSSPIFKFDNLINITGDVTGDKAVTKIQNAGDEIIKKLYDIYRTK